MTGARRLGVLGALAALGALLVPATGAHAAGPPGSAVVLVSGLGSASPFTTSAGACRSGQTPAGQNLSALRTTFVRAGYRVFTAPIMPGGGRVRDTPPAFSDCPTQLPASYTMDSNARLNSNVPVLVRFLGYLRRRYGIRSVYFVAHSMGGVLSRGATQRIGPPSTRRPFTGRAAASGTDPVRVRKIVTVSSPHIGSYLSEVIGGQLPRTLCGTAAICNVIVTVAIATANQYQPALSQFTREYLQGTNGRPGWNRRFGRVPRQVPLLALGGDALSTDPPSPDRFYNPNDGYVGPSSAHPRVLRDQGVIPSLRCAPLQDAVHSLGLAQDINPISPTKYISMDVAPATQRYALGFVRGSYRGVRC